MSRAGGAIGDYLVEIFKAYHSDHYAWSKVVWDISATSYLINPDWVPTQVVHSPILTDQYTWSHDPSRHFICVASNVKRDPIFRDVFQKLEQRAAQD
jgi:purine nucleosidase